MSDPVKREEELKKLQQKQQALGVIEKALPLLEKGFVHGAGSVRKQTYCVMTALNTVQGFGHTADSRNTYLEGLIAKEIPVDPAGHTDVGRIICFNDSSKKKTVLKLLQSVASKLRVSLPSLNFLKKKRANV